MTAPPVQPGRPARTLSFPLLLVWLAFACCVTAAVQAFGGPHIDGATAAGFLSTGVALWILAGLVGP